VLGSWHTAVAPTDSGELETRTGRGGVLGRLWHWEAQFSGQSGRSSPTRGAPRWHTSGGREPPAAGRRSGGGHRLGGRGVVVISGGGRGNEGSLRGRSERPVHVAALGGQGCDDGKHEEENAKGKPSALSSQRL
jgi:hypothetical protein